MQRCAVLTVLLLSPLLFARQPSGDAGGQGHLPLLLTNSGVRKELNLTPEQIDRIDKLNAELRAKMLAVLKEAQNTKDVEKIREKLQILEKEANTAFEKLVTDIFQPDQLRRLRQIELQTAGVQTFTRPDVRKRLNLTEQQTDDVRSAADKVRKESEQLRKEAFSGGRPDQDKLREVRKKTYLLNHEAAEKFNATLNEDQKKSWSELMGMRFDLKLD